MTPPRFFRLWRSRIATHYGHFIGGKPVMIFKGQALVVDHWELGDEVDPLEAWPRDKIREDWTMARILKQISRRADAEHRGRAAG